MFGYDSDKERVAKVLTDGTMTPRLRCQWGFHVWERWEPDAGQNYDGKTFPKNYSGNRYLKVHRVCRFCNRIQFSTMKE